MALRRHKPLPTMREPRRSPTELRIEELERHRREWRTRALRLYDSLSVLSRLSEQMLFAPVREAGIVVSVELRARIQTAVNEAQGALTLESPPAFDDGDDDAAEQRANEGKGNT